MGSIEQTDFTEKEALRYGTPFKHILVRSMDPDTKVFLLQSDSDEDRLGMCFQGLPLTGADESTMNRTKSVLSTAVPAGTFVQIGLLSEPDVSRAVQTYLSGKKDIDPLLSRLYKQRADFVSAGSQEPIKGMHGVNLCRQRVIFSVSIPCDKKPTPEQIKEISDLGTKYKEGLSSVGLWLNTMDEGEYLALLRRFTHMYEPDDFVVDDFASNREQVFGPGDAIEFQNDKIVYNRGQYYSKLLSIKHFPKTVSIGLMNALVGDPFGSQNQITEPFWLSTTIHYPDQHQKISAVRLKHAWLTKQSFGPMVGWIPILGYKKRGIDILIHEMDGGGGGMLCEMNFSMTLFARTEKRINEITSMSRAWASSYGFEMREDKEILKAMFYNLLPMNTTVNGIKNLYRFHTMAVSHAVQMLPILGNWHGSGPGGSSIFFTRRGTAVTYDPYDSQTNYNGIIFAESGAGKSFTSQQLICDWLANGARVWTIDQGRSYEKLCAAKKGQFIEFSEDSDICLNPFTHVVEIDEEMDILKAIFAKMAAPEKGLDDFGMSTMEEKIKAAYSKSGTKADVDLVAQMCLNDPDMRVQDLGRQLFPYTSSGASGRWFNGKNNVDLTNDFVVLELQELSSKKTLQQVVLIQLFSSISHEMYHTHGRRKYLVIDESWALLDDPVMAKAIEAAYRKVRKHDGSAWMITQNIADLYASVSGQAIISSSTWQFIMKQKSESIDRAVASGQLKLDLYTAKIMKSIATEPGKYAEIMIRNGDDWGVVKFISDRFAQILFSTKGWERDLIFDRMKAGEDVIEVIDQYVKEGK